MSGVPGEEFCVPYPVFFLLTDGSVNDDGTLADDARLVSMRNDRGEFALAVFTDQDLAERFHANSDDMTDRVVIGSFDNPADFANQLDAARNLGMTSVVFDPPSSKGHHPRTWPLHYATDRIRNAQDLL